MKTPSCISQQLPDDIVKIIDKYIVPDEIYDFPKTYSTQLINHICKNKMDLNNTCYSLPSYYDMIRNYQLSFLILKWKRKKTRDYPRVQKFKTLYNNKIIICSIYDTLCIRYDHFIPYTERTARVEIIGDVSNIQVQMHDNDTTFEKQQNKLWIWKRVDFEPELYENYIERYHSYTRFQMLKDMETLLLNIDF